MDLRVAWLLVGIGTFGHALDALGQTRTGREVYQFACAACHGSDGSGAPAVESGYPVVPPDFRDCNFSTREPAADWVGVSHHGGPNRAFSPLMPAFGEALSRQEIELAVSHARSFCTEEAWPRGEVNFPRALVTTKAFPEDEAVLTVIAADGVVTNKFVYERRVGPRSMFEVIAPLEFSERAPGDWTGGVGDLGFAVKHVLLASEARGSIVSAAAEVLIPTGSTERGIGSGTTVVEPFVAFGQRLPARAFFQAQVGGGIPFDRTQADEAFWRMVAGRQFRQWEFGRLWAPMVEVLGSRELTSGATTHWDVVPQMQVTLSTRQHIRVNLGVRVPVNERAGRSTQVLGYFMWEWFNGASMMAHAARDPYWHAGVRREVTDHPRAQAAIENECSRCHMPMAHVETQRRGGQQSVFANIPSASPAAAIDPLAVEGVSCAVCHQIKSDGLGSKASFTGGFVIETAPPQQGRQMFGPYEVEPGPRSVMRSATGLQPTAATHIQRSEVCATCHTLYTHALNASGEATSEFPEQMPYQEWLHSEFRDSQSCQSCHMPVVTELMPIASVVGQPREAVSRHDFRGANFLMLGILNRFRAELGVVARPAELDAAALRTKAFLQSSSANVAVERARVVGGRLEADVVVRNLAGHKLPTAYPSRRTWLRVSVRDGEGRVFFPQATLNRPARLPATTTTGTPPASSRTIARYGLGMTCRFTRPSWARRRAR